MRRVFSKFLHRKKESQAQTPQMLSKLQKLFSDAMIGRKTELSNLNIEGLFDTTTPETKRLQQRIDEIERRLSTLELNPILLSKDEGNQR